MSFPYRVGLKAAPSTKPRRCRGLFSPYGLIRLSPPSRKSAFRTPFGMGWKHRACGTGFPSTNVGRLQAARLFEPVPNGTGRHSRLAVALRSAPHPKPTLTILPDPAPSSLREQYTQSRLAPYRDTVLTPKIDGAGMDYNVYFLN